VNPTLAFLLALGIIILAAKTFGYLSTRLGQPAVLGELLIGILLGPTLLDMLHWPFFQGAHLEEVVRDLAELGVIFLMFIAGLEVDLETMRRSGRPAVLAGVLGVAVPILLGALVSLPFGFQPLDGIFIGLMMAATSVSISAQTMMELGVLCSPVGMALLGAAVVDDVLVIVLLSIFTALTGEGGGIGHILWMLFRMLLVMGAIVGVGMRLLPRLPVRVDRLPISEGVMALVVVVMLLFAWSAEALGGVAAITGAFLAGLFIARSPLHHYIKERMHILSYSWVVPVFFVDIGLEVNARAISAEGLGLTGALILAAVVSKVVGCGIGGLLGSFSFRDALRLGVGMTSRGEVGLIVASIGLTTGLIGADIFSSVVLMVLVTILITPILLRRLYRPPKQRGTRRALPEGGV